MARRRKERITSKSVFVPAPTGGWNTESSLESMPPTDAVRMINFFPDVGKVRYRGGTTNASLVPGPFTTAFSSAFRVTGATASTYIAGGMEAYHGTDGTSCIIAAIGSELYKFDPLGSMTLTGAVGITSPYWIGAQFGNIAGNYLFLANGTDNAKIFDGTTASDVGITGVTLSDIAWFASHQKRVWFGLKDSLRAYYLAPEAIAGAAVSFDLGGVAQAGGYIVNMWTWTRDGGDGVNDVAVFVTSEGEAILYQGTDPASTATWSLIGVFKIGAPINRRSAVQAGADLLIATYDGIVPISQVLGNTLASQQFSPYTAQILKGYREAVTEARANNINQVSLTVRPDRRMLLLNLGYDAACPRTQSSDDSEWSGNDAGWVLAFNTVTGKAAEFSGIRAGSFVTFQNDANPHRIYYANGLGVRILDEDQRSDDSGAEVKYECVPAFNDFGLPAAKKTVSRYHLVTSTLYHNPDPESVLMVDEQETAGPAFGDGSLNLPIPVYPLIRRHRKAGGRTGRSVTANVRIQSASSFTRADNPGEWLGVQYMFRIGASI